MKSVKVAKVKEVQKLGKKVITLGDEEILILSLDDGFYAVSNRCTHLNFPLSEGRIEDSVIECPGHRGKFDAKTGKVLSSPPKISLRTHRLKIEGEDIYLQLD
ncbi:MAG: non-heme iron oxygenase ferredoxin subunit [Nitrososphaerales archaeon]|nr:non-heme iron oxygenase ferredoxin subunit [Nitrososphaerales archaeon]